MARTLKKGKKKLKMRDNAHVELDALMKQLEENKLALQAEQEELNSSREQFRHDDEKGSIQYSRPQTAASQKSVADSNVKKHDDMEEFDDEKVLDEALAKVKELTGINDVESLIESLNQTEERNFSRFSYITHELENEAAKLDANIAQSERELERVKCRGLNDGTHRQKELRTMEEKKKQLDQKINEAEKEYQEQLLIWQRAKASICSCFDALSLSRPDSLLTTNGITENNVIEYLGAIEKVRQNLRVVFVEKYLH